MEKEKETVDKEFWSNKSIKTLEEKIGREEYEKLKNKFENN